MNAQNLPIEILELIGFFLFFESRSRIVNCTSVCRTWYTAFMRTLYYRIDSVYSDNTSFHRRYPTGRSLSNNSHLIHSLNLREHFPAALLSLGNEDDPASVLDPQQRCRLYSLMITRPTKLNVCPNSLAALVSYHTSTLTDIRITFSANNSESFSVLTNFWSNIGQCISLDHLVVKNFSIEVEEAEAFWKVCSRPRILEIYGMSLEGTEDVKLPNDGKSLQWPRIEKISLGRLRVRSATSVLMRFLTRCCNLASLSWRGSDIRSEAMMSFAENLKANVWPLLDSIDFRDISSLEDKEIAGVLSAIKPPQTLALFRASRSKFSTLSVKAMQTNGIFNSIRDLNLNRCDFMESSMVQEILESCHLLEVFLVRKITISTIIFGNPWVCTRMKYLCINIDVTGSQYDYEKQLIVFKQLSIMKDIEQLDISNGVSYKSPGPTLQLRLNSGLGELSAFSKLRELWFKGEQWMEMEDVQWFIENFTSLRNITGSMHMAEDTRKEYRKILSNRGINVFDNTWGILYEPVGGSH